MLIERILDREPGSLRGNNLESAFEAVIRGARGPIRRVLVIEEAEHAPDVLGHLALLTALLGSNAPALKIVLLGPPDFLNRCAPAIARRIDGDDVVDLRSLPDFPINLLERALAHVATPPNQAGKRLKLGRSGRGHRLLTVLGPAVLLIGAVSAEMHLAGWDTALAPHARSAAAPFGRLLARGGARPDEPPSGSQQQGAGAPAPSPSASEAPSGPPTPPAPPPPAAETLQPAPAPQPTAARPEPAFPPAVLADLMRRGNAMLADGDVTEARLFFERGASGSAAAAVAVGKTYDPAFLDQIGARGVQPDRTTAASWYERARAMGDPAAADLLERLQATAHE